MTDFDEVDDNDETEDRFRAAVAAVCPRVRLAAARVRVDPCRQFGKVRIQKKRLPIS